ncbi:MAG TPA: TetR family transcriptional regulator [Nitrolancea sp.]|jgi:AcrR family transcriptional regulator|nr:TetR family transcriptional regulator [Nitrolancea sp.]
MPEANDGEQRMQDRRAPSGDARQRDAERSRQLLLNAALDEFAAKGFAGARVQDIAARAGVNKQLITYYFGGKEGLYQALNQLWLEQEASFAWPDLPLDTLMAEYVHASLADPRLGRLLIWAGLTGQSDASEEDESESVAREDVADLQRRQAAGEIAADLDPGLVLLALMGAGIAPIAMPQVVRRITGLDIQSPEFEAAYAEQLKRIVRLLGGHERQ